MTVVFHQERHHGVALRRAPQPASFQGPFDRLDVHEEIRLYLIWKFVKSCALVAARMGTGAAQIPGETAPAAPREEISFAHSARFRNDARNSEKSNQFMTKSPCFSSKSCNIIAFASKNTRSEQNFQPELSLTRDNTSYRSDLRTMYCVSQRRSKMVLNNIHRERRVKVKHSWIGLLCLLAAPLSAQEAKVIPLMTKDLTGLPGKEASVVTVEYAPGSSSSEHRHNAHTFVYVLEGSVVMQVKGGKEVTLGPGETFYESPEDIHTVSRNASNTKRAKFLVFFVKDKGAPATVPVK